MNLKTCRILQIIAVALLAVALLVTVICFFARGTVMRAYSYDPGLRRLATFPVVPFIVTLLRCVIAAVFLFLLYSHPSKGALKGTVIALAAVLLFLDIALSPLLSQLVTWILGRKGSMILAANSILNSAISSITHFFIAPANILMLLTMGASLQLDLTSPSVQQPPVMPPYGNPYPPYPYQ
ncbi:MAG: hypothetical protein II781_05000 [Clostridia bacterium]|nr:hypothetical protein [Clostridia bacterium]